MTLDQAFDALEFSRREALVVLHAHRLQPQLGDLVVAPHWTCFGSPRSLD
ncbi:MAG: hypothetical protein O2930_01495 [Acidobacteria bacterium]|nr:hypothetical protein [Acidobacteriota bacterium]